MATQLGRTGLDESAASDLIKFDSKLHEITRILQQYKNLLAVDNGEQPSGEAAAWGHQGQGGAGAGGSGRKLATPASSNDRRRTNDDGDHGFKLQPEQPPVRAFGPGVSRNLCEKIYRYRNSATARAELHERAKRHIDSARQKLGRRPASAYANAGAGNAVDDGLLGALGLPPASGPVDFVACNKDSISRPSSPPGLLSMSRPMASPQHRHGHSGSPSRHAAEQPPQSPTSAAAVYSFAAGRAASFAVSRPSTAPQPGPPHANNINSGSRSSVTASASGRHTAPAHALRASVSAARGTPRPASCALEEGSPKGPGVGTAGPGLVHSATVPASGHRMQASRGSTPTDGASDSRGMGGAFGNSGPLLLELPHRSVRLLLTSRPASGGSPSRRPEYLADKMVAAEAKARHDLEVRQRADVLAAERQAQVSEAAAHREMLRQEKARAAEEARAADELWERQRQWTGYVSVLSRLAFLRQVVVEDRQQRPLLHLRKEAAKRLAHWYKRVLLRRRQVELVELTRRLRRALAPHVATARLHARERAAMRIIDFMRFMTDANMAMIAIKRFRLAVLNIQSCWRTAVMVRRTQKVVLAKWLQRYERQLVRANLKAARMAAHAQGLSRDRGNSPTRTALPSQPGGGGLNFGGQLPTGAEPTAGLGSVVAPRQSAYGAGPAPPPRSSHFGGTPGQHAAAAGTKQGGGIMATARRGAHPGAHLKSIEIEDPELEAQLAAHKEPLPPDIIMAVTDEALIEERKKFYKLLEQYRSDRTTYLAQKPIEDLRLKMLRDAGLNAVPQYVNPVHPRMCSLLPRARLKHMIRRGMQMMEEARDMALALRRATLDDAPPGSPTQQGGPSRPASPEPSPPTSPKTMTRRNTMAVRRR